MKLRCQLKKNRHVFGCLAKLMRRRRKNAVARCWNLQFSSWIPTPTPAAAPIHPPSAAELCEIANQCCEKRFLYIVVFGAQSSTMIDRFNTPHSDGVEVDVFGHNLLIKQDPNSKHLGTTVWDSSLVFVKFLERNSKKGEFSPAKLAGKRVIELGAGCGLAGLGMALLGCDVVVTDQIEVIPLLLKNVERNLARAKYKPSDSSYMGSIGKVDVAELDWGNETHIGAAGPPFDYIIGTDVVYKEQYVEPLINTILALAGPKSTVLLGYEFRSTAVSELLHELCHKHFFVKRVLRSKMDPNYQHPDIDLYIMRVHDKSDRDSCGKQEESPDVAVHHQEEEKASGGVEEPVCEAELYEFGTPSTCTQSQLVTSYSVNKDNVFGVRRLGSAAARLLSEIKPPI